MRKALEIGGYVAAVVLIAFGVAAIYMGVQGRTTVSNSIKDEQIVGSADMTPSGIAAEVKASGLKNVTIPSCSVANKAITSGSDARCFAEYMRIHALESSGGLTYSQMPRYATADGKGTNDAAAAQKGPSGQPLDNAGPQHLGHGDGAGNGSQHVVPRHPDRELRDRGRNRAAAVGNRVRDPRARRRAPQSGLCPLRQEETAEKPATTTPVSA